MKLYARNVDSLSPHTHTSTDSVLSIGCLVSGKNTLLPPQGHCFAYGASWLSFSILFSLLHRLRTSSFFSSVAHFYSEKTIILTQKNLLLFFFHSPSLFAIPPTHVSLHFVLFSIKIVPLDKRGTDAFTDRRGDEFVCNR